MIIFTQVYGVFLVGRAMIRFTHALSLPASKSLLQTIDEQDSYEYYSESDNSNEKEEKVDKKDEENGL